jgi:hypothetical protein
MKTLYLRNVPDEAVDQLQELATREGMSVSALAVRELIEAISRAGNRQKLAELPMLRISWEDLVASLDEERRNR